MTNSNDKTPEDTARPNAERRLRMWPAVLLVAIQWPVRFVLPVVVPEALPFCVMGGLFLGLLVGAWWVFFSRAPLGERWKIALFVLALFVLTPFVAAESIATAMMGLMIPVYGVPPLSLGFVLWALLTQRSTRATRRRSLALVLFLAFVPWTLLRTGGFSSELDHDLALRWSETPEEKLLARTEDEPSTPPADPISLTGDPEWPGFRGALRDGRVHDTAIATDWNASPPTELWSRPVGPGWSSFAVHGDLFFTQEQRGEEELVSCYRVSTGEPVWKHRDTTRFWEAIGGAGPRATPTLAGGQVFALGATGILNVLDAATGELVWSRNAADDAEIEIPEWALAGSPLVTDTSVIVAVSGRLAAFDRATGEPLWFGPDGEGGYSSPHFFSIDGSDQVLLMSKTGALSMDPSDGSLIWDYPWEGTDRIVQPTVGNGALFFSAGERRGMRRVDIRRDADGWILEERWNSKRLKPHFSDSVVHGEHMYGFDSSILTCIDLAEGERVWKGGRYGSGQLILLADQNLLLVLSETGELALVSATPDSYTELGRVPGIEGKTWNHPVLVGDTLLVRNAEEMAAFRLAQADSTR